MYCVEEGNLKLHHICKTESWLNRITWIVQSWTSVEIEVKLGDSCLAVLSSSSG